MSSPWALRLGAALLVPTSVLALPGSSGAASAPAFPRPDTVTAPTSTATGTSTSTSTSTSIGAGTHLTANRTAAAEDLA